MRSDKISHGYKINPLEFVEKKQYLKGSLDLNKMLRLKEMCHPNQNLSQAQIWLEGDIDQQGLYYLSGAVTAILPLTCQRCLEIMDYGVTAEFMLSPVHTDDEAQKLPSSYEPLYLSETDMVSLSEMIEDELMLSLPLVAKHDKKDCLIKS